MDMIIYMLFFVGEHNSYIFNYWMLV